MSLSTSVAPRKGDTADKLNTSIITATTDVTNNASSAATFSLGTHGLSARSGSAFKLGALAGEPSAYLGMASNSGSANCT